MRIIAGEFRHRKLHSPPDAGTTRPIPDRVKESLFALLRGWTEGAVVLDAFAGTGAIGLEAISRGAQRCVFIERDKKIAQILRRNIEELGCEDRAEVVQGDALGAPLLSRCPRPVDLIFFDPPYPLVLDPSPAMGGGGGWDRVARQFARVIENLNTSGGGGGGGYAVLRTPWPFRHRSLEPGSSKGRSESERRRGRGHSGRSQPIGDDEVAWEGDELSDMLRGGPSAFEHDHDPDESLPSPPPPASVQVDLSIPGAVGPETHVYGNTAIHLYMKQA
ncbi:MAG: 16S rRNA (guanine(966)-N(2))-methyltransferase RsmD [Phycisphaerales bacterium]